MWIEIGVSAHRLPDSGICLMGRNKNKQLSLGQKIRMHCRLRLRKLALGKDCLLSSSIGLSKERLETMSSILNCNDEAGADVFIKVVYLKHAIVSNTLTPQSTTSVEKRPFGKPRFFKIALVL